MSDQESYQFPPSRLSLGGSTNQILTLLAMDPSNFCYNDLSMYAHDGYNHWTIDSMTHSYPNDAIVDTNALYYPPTEMNTSLTNMASFFPRPHLPFPVDSLSNPEPTNQFHPFLDSSIPSDPLVTWRIPVHHLPAQSTSFTSPPTIVPTVTLDARPATAPTSLTPQKTKFPCTSCGKTYTERQRAQTCLLNHTGTKPFTCNGSCGTVGW
ncbi:hypothetical protein CPB86DRAFT_379005 [Serendipita vermifera]|nr:hypothetical protein CPB86DRAFT_379005 [Serendipita vermifera]